MRKVFFVTMFLFGALTLSFAQTTNSTVKKEVKKVEKSKLVCENPDGNLGTVPQGIPATAVYKLKNTGDTPIVITNVRTSCGCTSKSYKKEPIKPGETTEIQASYNARNVGPFYKTVTVTTNEGVGPMVFKIRGKVEAKKTAEEQKS